VSGQAEQEAVGFQNCFEDKILTLVVTKCPYRKMPLKESTAMKATVISEISLVVDVR